MREADEERKGEEEEGGGGAQPREKTYNLQQTLGNNTENAPLELSMPDGNAARLFASYCGDISSTYMLVFL